MKACHDCGVTPGHPHYRHCSDYSGDVPYGIEPGQIVFVPDDHQFRTGMTGAKLNEALNASVATESPSDWEQTYGARLVTSSTGGSKGRKAARLGDLDPMAILAVAEVAGYGADKYTTPTEPGRLNYMKGYDWSLCFDALQRHALAFWGGEDLDPESGLPHLAHAAWHCLALLAFSARDLGTDDRYKEPS